MHRSTFLKLTSAVVAAGLVAGSAVAADMALPSYKKITGVDGSTVVSARPSDAVALALRTGAPLYIADELMASEGVLLAEEDLADDEVADEGEAEEVVEEFIEFLDTIRPEDFSG